MRDPTSTRSIAKSCPRLQQGRRKRETEGARKGGGRENHPRNFTFDLAFCSNGLSHAIDRVLVRWREVCEIRGRGRARARAYVRVRTRPLQFEYICRLCRKELCHQICGASFDEISPLRIVGLARGVIKRRSRCNFGEFKFGYRKLTNLISTRNTT